MIYKIILSTGDPIKVNKEELESVLAGINSGNPVKVNQGIFNPSFFVSIQEERDYQGELPSIFVPQLSTNVQNCTKCGVLIEVPPSRKEEWESKGRRCKKCQVGDNRA